MLLHLREMGMPLVDIAQFTGVNNKAANLARLRVGLLTAIAVASRIGARSSNERAM